MLGEVAATGWVIGNGFSGYCYFGQICSGIANLIIGSEPMHCIALSVRIMSATLTDYVCFIIFCCFDVCVLARNTTILDQISIGLHLLAHLFINNF